METRRPEDTIKLYWSKAQTTLKTLCNGFKGKPLMVHMAFVIETIRICVGVFSREALLGGLEVSGIDLFPYFFFRLIKYLITNSLASSS